jgi:DNA repair protein RadA/Sms
MKLKLETVKYGTLLSEIQVPDFLREKVATGLKFVDDVMSGGFTPSTVTLFSGTSGAGKSTMTQLMADGFKSQGHEVIFVSGEESPYQIKMTSERLRLKHGYKIASETYLPDLLPMLRATQAKLKPGQRLIVMFDSLQTLNDGKYGLELTNSKTENRSLQEIINFCKDTASIGIVIAQVNKAGKIAGSNKLKHMVDVHLHLSIEEKDEELYGCRLLEVTKNRFGFSGSLTFLKLESHGFEVVANAINKDEEDEEDEA